MISGKSASKATGLGGINTRFLKVSPGFIAEPITLIFNCLLKSSLIPADWKTAKVSPLHKEGSRNEVSN